MVFVSCSIENPSFDSQSKDSLVSKSQTFGSECKLSKTVLKDIVKAKTLDVRIYLNNLRQKLIENIERGSLHPTMHL